MKHKLQIFIEYKIKSDFVEQYEAFMQNLIVTLPEFGVNKIEWYSSSENDFHYIEMYEVPSESYYFALKRLRDNIHPNSMFSSFKTFLTGHTHYWVFKKAI